LLIANSYSGSTEETLSAVEAAEAAGAHIVAVARGGTLIDIAKQKGYPYLILPETPQPRLGTLSGFASLLAVTRHFGITNDDASSDILARIASRIQKELQAWTADVPTKNNVAKQLALEVAGTAPVIYAGPEMIAAAYKWKIGFNEAAKNVAWYNEIPEFCHNEFLGWSSHPVDKPYSIIDLRSSFEHSQVSKRFELTDRLLSGKRPHTHTVQAKGETVFEHMLYLMVLGDFVSIYVGLLNGVDPTDFSLVDTFKKGLR
jgi:glucose/mannose-6-phosphate isomerase